MREQFGRFYQKLYHPGLRKAVSVLLCFLLCVSELTVFLPRVIPAVVYAADAGAETQQTDPDGADADGEELADPENDTETNEIIDEKTPSAPADGAPYWLLIGDSYCLGKNGHSLGAYLAEELNLREKGGILEAHCHFGSGAANRTSSFLSLLKKADPSRDVTDILFCGGINNDRGYKREKIELAIRKLAVYARRKYPNARIMYCIGNWYAHPDTLKSRQKKRNARNYQKRIRERTPWYRSACRKNGIFFLSSVSKTLRGKQNRKYFREDGHHPTREARRKLAGAIADAAAALNRKTKVRSISLNRRMVVLRTGERFCLCAKTSPANAVSGQVLYVSSDPAVCRAGKRTGVLTAVSRGSCLVRCIAADGSGTERICLVKVS